MRCGDPICCDEEPDEYFGRRFVISRGRRSTYRNDVINLPGVLTVASVGDVLEEPDEGSRILSEVAKASVEWNYYVV
jgi:hypothetical protein